MKKVKRALLLGVVAGLVVSPATAHHGPANKVVVKPHKLMLKKPKVLKYHRHKLPRTAVFAVIAGVSYAIIGEHYYRRHEGHYVYVANPPARIVQAEASPAPEVKAGSLVDLLPEGTSTVTVNGATFFVHGSIWYAPIAGTDQFVVVAPQL